MKHYLNLVTIAAKVHRRQSRMTRVCIGLAVFFTAVMFGLADMYLQGITQKEKQTNGDWHYQFASVDQGTAELISARTEIKSSGWRNVISPEAGYLAAGKPVGVSGQDRIVFEEIFLNSIVEGSYPDGENEIAVSLSLKESASLSLNGTVELTRPDGGTVSFSVVGFIDSGRAAEVNEWSAAMTPEGIFALTAQSDCPADERYVIQLSRFCSMPDVIADIKADYHISDGQVTENLSLLSIEGQLEGKTGVNQIYQIAFLLSVFVMLTCILMISSSLNSNVAQRTEFFGMLRCLGATKKQILRFVRYEGLYWSKTAIPAGMLLSVFVVWILSTAMRAVSPRWFSYMPRFGISWKGMTAGALLGLFTVLLAARSPAKRAAKVSPAAAVSGNTGPAASFRKAADIRLFRIETALGIYHARAEKRNYVFMTGAFAVCITLFLTFSTLVDFMENAFLPPPWTPELSVASEANTCSIGVSKLEQIIQNDGVKSAYGRMFAYDVPVQYNGYGRAANVISYEENQFRWAAGALTAGSMEPVMRQEDQVLIVRPKSAAVQVGDKITLFVGGKQHTVTVAGILADSPLARAEGMDTVFCSESTFTELTGQNGYTIIDIQFHANASQKNVEEIKNIFSDGVIFADKYLQVRQQKNLYSAFSVLVYGFLSTIIAITVIHIRNTVNMGAAAKMKQFGAMRAIGMSTKQLLKIIAAEAGTYAAGGVILGCIIGIPMHWLVYVSLITNFWGTEWRFPCALLFLIACIVLVTSLLAVRDPVQRLYKMSIVENIGAQ